MRILTEPKNALCRQYRKLLELDNVTLEFENAALDAIAQKAIDRKIGARGLRAVLESVMTKVMYDIPSDPTISEVLITRAAWRTEASRRSGTRPALRAGSVRAQDNKTQKGALRTLGCLCAPFVVRPRIRRGGRRTMNELILSERMPVLAMRGLVLFPQATMHFDVGREKSVRALEAAMNADQHIFW